MLLTTPNRVATGRVGMRHGNKLDSLIWEEFAERGDSLIEEGIELLGRTLAGGGVPTDLEYAVVDLPPVGGERVAERTERINQQYFRNSLLRNYRERCCLTGLAEPKLLVASHIKPWAASDPKTERLAATTAFVNRGIWRYLLGLNHVFKDEDLLIYNKLLDNIEASER